MDNYEGVPMLEIEALSNPDRTYADAMRNLETNTSFAVGNLDKTVGNVESSDFEKGIRLKTALDMFEQKAQTKPTWELLSLLVNYERRLWNLYADTPIRHNPFLVHWVEAFQRMDTASGAPVKNEISPRNDMTAKKIATIRAEWIKRLLLSRDAAELGSSTPRVLHHKIVTLGSIQPFDIQPYINMLVEEGIYDTQHESDPDLNPLPNTSTPSENNPSYSDPQQYMAAPARTQNVAESGRLEQGAQPRLAASKQWKQEMYRSLKEDRDAAVQELTRLPLELSFLDFINELLTERTLEAQSIDPAPIITGYIQHSLRVIEMMGAPPPASSPHPSSINGTSTGTTDNDTFWEYGKEAQSRSVKLLVLFIKNLIRKGLLGPDLLYFEIQEICVRYVWIKEVRDFRSWVEEGDAGD